MERERDADEVRIHAMLEQVWKASFDETCARAQRILDAAATSTDPLAREEKAAARDAAHKLAGSLGMFGLHRGSVLARDAEKLLAAPLVEGSAEQQRLREIGAELLALIQEAHA